MIETIIGAFAVGFVWILFISVELLMQRRRRARDVREYVDRMRDVDNGRAAYRQELVRLELARKKERDRALRVTNDYLEGTRGFGR